MKIKPICIIPARAGSVRIKNKNILKINKIPLIGRVIKIAFLSNLFSRIIVTTDSKKIASVAIKYKAEVPFLRASHLSNSSAKTKDVIHDTIKKISSYNITTHFCIYPTAILIEAKDLKKAYLKFLNNKKADAVLAVTRERNFYRMLVKRNNQLVYKWQKYSFYNSQKLPQAYIDSGTFFIFKTKEYLKAKSNLPKNTIPYEIDKFKGIEVNTLEDLKFLKTIIFMQSKNR